MKEIILRNWPAKLATLAVAIAIWFLVNYIVKTENPGSIYSDAEEAGR